MLLPQVIHIHFNRRLVRSGGEWVITRDHWGEGNHSMPSNHTKELAFSSPVSGHLALVFYQGHSPEAHKHGTTHACPLAWNLQQNPHYPHWCNTESWASAFQHRPWSWVVFHLWGMIQPGRQDQTGTYQRREGWVVEGREEKQTEVRAGWVSWLLGCSGREAGASRGSEPTAGAAPNTAAHWPIYIPCSQIYWFTY